MSELPAYLTDADLETLFQLHKGYFAQDRCKSEPRLRGWVKIGSQCGTRASASWNSCAPTRSTQPLDLRHQQRESPAGQGRAFKCSCDEQTR
jgi:hypothetical protein